MRRSAAAVLCAPAGYGGAMGPEDGLRQHVRAVKRNSRKSPRILPSARVRTLQDPESVPENTLKSKSKACVTVRKQPCGIMYRITIKSFYDREDNRKRIYGFGRAAPLHPAVFARRRCHREAGGTGAAAIFVVAGDPRPAGRSGGDHPCAGRTAFFAASQHSGADRSHGSTGLREADARARGPTGGTDFPSATGREAAGEGSRTAHHRVARKWTRAGASDQRAARAAKAYLVKRGRTAKRLTSESGHYSQLKG